ncbi:hypothetical protein GCM10009117_01240 [Gangjinia marincola]|uniref:Uncharacterized protein n=1 Tax=Gangjinia marincola TaxID=578463 RepID=A0ABN1MCZ8_9FLAO
MTLILNGYALLKREIINNTRNTKNRILAISAAVPEIAPKPSIPAIIAITTKIMVHFNMMFKF